MAQDRGDGVKLPGSAGMGNNGWKPPVKAPANVPISFPIPEISSTPAYSQPYTPPPAPYYPPAAIPQTPSFGIGAPTGGGMGGSPAPAPQVKPVMSEGDWLKGDSTYQNQLSEYGTGLNDFLARLSTQKSDFMSDFNTSKEGWGKNRDAGLLSVGEDFTNRGMGNSGLFAKASDDAALTYKKQGDALDKGKDRAMGDFTNQEKDKRASTEKAKNNAKSASLGRMADDQMFK